MLATLIIAGVTSVFTVLSVLFKPEIKIGKFTFGTYWIVALVGAACALIFKTVDFSEVFKNLTADTAVNPLKILALFLSMTVFSVFLDEIGFFAYFAEKVLALARNSQKKLFLYLYLTVSVLTVFTSNDIIILTFTPFICVFAKRSGIDPKPYLFAEFVAANTWSMALIIGNPTNIYIGQTAGIGFFEYFSVMILPTVAAGTVAFLILYALFNKSLSASVEVKPSETEVKIKDRFLLVVGVAVLVICIILLAISSYIGVELWLVCVILLAVETVISVAYLLLSKKGLSLIGKTLKRAPYELIPFVLSMFVIVSSLESSGVTGYAREFLSGNGEIWTYGASSFLTANLINNIPMSVLFSKITVSVKSVYATIVGSNLGAIFTPVGALAGIMWCNLLKKHELKFSFKDFVKYGAVVSLPSLAACLGVLSLLV